MELHGGMVPPEIKRKVREGLLPQYVVCGVDVYKTSETIREDSDDRVDFNRLCPFKVRSAAFFQGLDSKYFTGRYYRLIDLLHEDEYFPFSDTRELRRYMIENTIGAVNMLPKETLESDDEDTAYVLSPLTKKELSDLLDYKKD